MPAEASTTLAAQNDKSIVGCQRRSKEALLHRRYGTLSSAAKHEIFQMEMSMCLEEEYMKCIQRVNQAHVMLSSIEICEPLVKEYVRNDQMLNGK
jgi:hypothetical protein